MSQQLEDYPNKISAGELLEGFSEGFKLKYQGPREATEANNLKSALQAPEVLKEKIAKEILLGRVAGPFLQRPLKNLRISPLGLVPKNDGDF